jgi:hypothetical protein
MFALLMLALLPAAQGAPTEPTVTRILVPRVLAPDAPQDAVALTDAILVVARRFPEFEVIAISDLSSMLSVEAERQALGCSSDIACFSEVADALGAPEMLSAQVTRTGDTWQLTLSRIDRSTAQAKARQQVRADGPGAEVLLPHIEAGVTRLMGHTFWSGWVPTGAVIGVVGLVGVGTAAALYAVALGQYQRGVDSKDNVVRAEAKAAGEPLYLGSVIAFWSGALLTVAGAGLLAFGWHETFAEEASAAP